MAYSFMHAGFKIEVVNAMPGSIHHKNGVKAVLHYDDEQHDNFFTVQFAKDAAERTRAFIEGRGIEYNSHFIEVLVVQPGSVREAIGDTHRVEINAEWVYTKSLAEAQKLVDRYWEEYFA
jgi:hypothetical protein